MFIFLLTLLLMCAAPILHIIWCLFRLKGKANVTILLVTAVCLLLGIALPILASYIDIANLHSDTRCATGSVGFAMVGMALTVIIIPVSSVAFYIYEYLKFKKT